MPGAGGLSGSEYGSDAYTNAMRMMAMGQILQGGNGGSYFNYMQQLGQAKAADARFAAQQAMAVEERDYERAQAAAELERQQTMMQAAQGGMAQYFGSQTPNPVSPFRRMDGTGDSVAADAMAYVRPELFPGLSQDVINAAARTNAPAASALIKMFYDMPDDMGQRTRAEYDDGQATFSYNDQAAREYARETAPDYGYGFANDNPTAKFGAQNSMPTPVTPERMSQIMMNPMVPKEIKEQIMARFGPQEDDRTAEMRNLEWRAQQAGLEPGTQEYREFIMNGGEPAGNSLSVKTSDGTSISWGPSGVAPGSDPLTTATPRDQGKLAESMSSADASYITVEKEKARAAEDLVDLSTRLETLSGEVGYTGPGGKLLGSIDDAIRVLPGDSGARGAFRSASTEAQLLFTERTKGAITEREMALFASAVPSLSQTPEANKMIAQSLKAGAERVKARANFMEEWAGKYGSLEGANDAWGRYINANPILTKDEETGALTINPEGNWREALTGQAKIELNPLTIMQMSPVEFGQINPDMIATFTLPQLEAYEKRRRELGQ